MQPLVTINQNEGVAACTLNRPEAHNSLTIEMLQALFDVLDESASRRDSRVVLLSAKGRSFSTGIDWSAVPKKRKDAKQYLSDLAALLNRLIVKMITHPLPIITIAHDIVSDAALGLTLASDILLVAPQTDFVPFGKQGAHCPIGGWATILPDVIGQKRAADVLFRAKPLHAVQAVQWGMANALVPADHLREKAQRMAREIAEQDPGTMQSVKRLLWQDSEELARRLEIERQAFLACFG